MANLMCSSCKGYIFKGDKKIKDGVYLTEDYDSEAICEDCIDSSHIEDN